MSDEVRQYLQAGKKNLILIYALFLGGILIPLLPLIGAVFAYANLSCPNIIWQTHYIFAFRTFCFSAIGICIAMLVSMFFIHYLLHAFIFIWFTLRSIVALQLLLERNSHPNPLTFGIK